MATEELTDPTMWLSDWQARHNISIIPESAFRELSEKLAQPTQNQLPQKTLDFNEAVSMAVSLCLDVRMQNRTSTETWNHLKKLETKLRSLENINEDSDAGRKIRNKVHSL